MIDVYRLCFHEAQQLKPGSEGNLMCADEMFYSTQGKQTGNKGDIARVKDTG